MENSFINKSARIISTIFIPPSFTIILFTFFAFYIETESSKIIVTLLTSYLLGFAAPIILFIVLRKRKLLADGDASIKEERTLPFSISIIFYLIGFYILLYFEVNIILIAFWFCYISNTIITIFINRFWKMSVHTVGAAGPLAALTFVIGSSGLLLSLILLAVGWSRIKLKCHTFLQVLAGAFIAFISTYVQIYLIVKIFSN